jgi:hypothetical protein
MSNGVSVIGNDAFVECSRLAGVTIPQSVSTIGEAAFYFCGFTSVTIPAAVTNIGYQAFSEDFNMTNFFVDPLNPDYASAGGVLFNKNLKTLIEYPGGRSGSYVIPAGTTTIAEGAFEISDLTSVTIPASVTSIGSYAFNACDYLTNIYFQGNAPAPDNTEFSSDSATIYYLPGATGWMATFDGLPTALSYLPRPVIVENGFGFNAQNSGFGFTISWATNTSVVVEACTNLANPVWLALQTNALVNGTNYFSDDKWANYPGRYYRVRTP